MEVRVFVEFSGGEGVMREGLAWCAACDLAEGAVGEVVRDCRGTGVVFGHVADGAQVVGEKPFDVANVVFFS